MVYTQHVARLTMRGREVDGRWPRWGEERRAG